MRLLLRLVPGVLFFAAVGALGAGPATKAWRRHQLEERLEQSEERQERFSKGLKDRWIQQRAYPTGQIPQGAMRRADHAMRSLPHPSPPPGDPPALAWQPVDSTSVDVTNSGLTGLANAAGRSTAIALGSPDAKILFLGTAQGGVWKSTDGGLNWAALTDSQPSLAIGSLLVSPTNPQFVYAGTGEGRRGGDSYYGQGLLRSQDGGQSWDRPAGERFAGVSIIRLFADPAGKTLYLATTFDSTGEGYCQNTYYDNPDQGVFSSTDGGVTWAQLFNGPVTDLDIDFSGPQPVFFASRLRDGVYRFSAGQDPVLLSLPGFATQPAALESQVAIAPSNPKVMYASPAITTDHFTSDHGTIYRSLDGGQTWAEMPGAPNHCQAQCDYDNVIEVDPTNPDIAYFGGSLCSVWKLEGGTTDKPVWKAVSMPGANCDDVDLWYQGSVHPDLHAITIVPGTPATVLTASDGGFAISKNSGKTWKATNTGLATLQFYAGCLHPTNPKVVLGGTQDNGYVSSNGTGQWAGLITGDGLGCTLQPDGTLLFLELGGALYRGKFNNNSFDLFSAQVVFDPACSVAGVDGCNEPNSYFPPLTFDPQDPSHVYLATSRLWRSIEGGKSNTWKTMSPTITAGDDGFFCDVYQVGMYPTSDMLTDVAVSGGGQTIYTISAAGVVAGTADGGENWAMHSGGALPTRYGSGVAVDAAAPSTVYASFSGFSESTPQTPGHVFRSTDQGKTWEGAEPGGIDLPVNVLAAHPVAPGVVYAGTDLGVMVSYDGGENWEKVATGFPNVAVYWLKFHTATSRLVAGTHGRSAWVLPLTAALEASPATLSLTVEQKAQAQATVSARNSGQPGSLAHVTATTTTAWITAPTTPQLAAGKALASFPLTIQAADLALGSYEGKVSLADPAASNGPVEVTIQLTVIPEGSGGQGGTGGQGGSAGAAGKAGNAGQAGAAGNAGHAGTAGHAGKAGMAGNAGNAGMAGHAGTGGESGNGQGGAGTAGVSGAGQAGAAGQPVAAAEEPIEVSGGCAVTGRGGAGGGWLAALAIGVGRRARRRREQGR